MRFRTLLTTLAAFGLTTSPLMAQPAPDIRLDWRTMDGGGAMYSVNRSLQLGGTIGQPDAGPTMSNRGLTLTGGFWVVTHAGEGTPCVGDLNGDNQVSLNDLALLLAEFGCVSNCTADITNDGQVTLADLALLLSHFGEICE
jgi:hypothetical protein